MRPRHLIPFILFVPVLGYFLPEFLSCRRAAPRGAAADRIVVLKSRKCLYLFRGEQLVGQYPVALGKNPGRKTTRGDKKTPEGRYENCRLKEASSFHKAIVITYPNPGERRQGFTGGNIEIHGLPALPRWLEHHFGSWIILLGDTDGCVMVTNRDMDEILAAVTFPVTVEIQP